MIFVGAQGGILQGTASTCCWAPMRVGLHGECVTVSRIG